MKPLFLVFTVAVAWAFAVPSPAFSDVRIAETGTVYPTISAALAAAPAGATIEVSSGDYREAIVIARPVSLLGKDNGGGAPRIDGGAASSAIEIKAAGVVVNGFEITASRSRSLQFGVFSSYSEEACVMVRASGAVISNNSISGCHYGVYLRGVESGAVELNEIVGNRFGGIFVLNSRNVGIRGNRVEANAYNGISVGTVVFPPGMMQAMRPLAGDVVITAETRPLDALMSSDIEIAGNDVSGHGHAGIVVGTARRVAILSNKAYANGGQPVPRANPPVVLGSSPDIRGYGIGLICDTSNSRVEANEAENNDSLGILLDTAYANHVGTNSVSSNGTGIGLFGSTGNTLQENHVRQNAEFGIRLERGLPSNPPPIGNMIIGNDLDGNGANAFDTSGRDAAPARVQGVAKGGPVDRQMLSAPNQWDDGKSGNRYSDFDEAAEGFVDANGDGIGEVAHPIPGGNAVDHYPLATSVKFGAVISPAGVAAAAVCGQAGLFCLAASGTPCGAPAR